MTGRTDAVVGQHEPTPLMFLNPINIIQLFDLTRVIGGLLATHLTRTISKQLARKH
jgi:hypothetical protein